eukprot:TRINITY_DN54566_c0_g1_i2.p1 TRINITY_DN54566_c0_g1~~TRINITY_DN54566_c0_g1_i2.p1  ORF type:complete len:157 (+),score=50.59 TRINITY_DN54566_c0_g1_i2:57-473(+)
MLRSLVGSEMCIRDRDIHLLSLQLRNHDQESQEMEAFMREAFETMCKFMSEKLVVSAGEMASMWGGIAQRYNVPHTKIIEVCSLVADRYHVTSSEIDNMWNMVWSTLHNVDLSEAKENGGNIGTVSYTHLTLPTKRIV